MFKFYKRKNKPKKISINLLELHSLISFISLADTKNLTDVDTLKYIHKVNEFINKVKEENLADWQNNIEICKEKFAINVEGMGLRGIKGYRLKINNFKIIIDNEEDISSYNTFEIGCPEQKKLVGQINYSLAEPIVYVGITSSIFIFKNSIIQKNINFSIKGGVAIEFIDNEFINTNLRIEFKEHDTQDVVFEENKFKNSTLNIFADTGEIIDDSNLEIDNKSNEKEYQKGWKKPTAIIDNNTLDAIKLNGQFKINFKGINKINLIEVVSSYPQIIWNPYQKISSDIIARINAHKELFLDLKVKAGVIRDNFHEEYYRVEIAKCEHQMLKTEKKSIAFQDRFLLQWSKCSSNYGSSWLKPILWMLSINFIIAIILTCRESIGDIVCFQCRVLQQTFELFIPFELFERKPIAKTCMGAIYTVLNVIHKALYAALIYETVKSFRRFSGK